MKKKTIAFIVAGSVTFIAIIAIIIVAFTSQSQLTSEKVLSCSETNTKKEIRSMINNDEMFDENGQTKPNFQQEIQSKTVKSVLKCLNTKEDKLNKFILSTPGLETKFFSTIMTTTQMEMKSIASEIKIDETKLTVALRNIVESAFKTAKEKKVSAKNIQLYVLSQLSAKAIAKELNMSISKVNIFINFNREEFLKSSSKIREEVQAKVAAYK